MRGEGLASSRPHLLIAAPQERGCFGRSLKVRARQQHHLQGEREVSKQGQVEPLGAVGQVGPLTFRGSMAT
ncbi:hypothetical protein E2C01_049161 [Portunus trituberculatus]|uniref:Uncharacterized protein n=1 Tax=Portunus trituberculatus TaxID=210409 RepID=A0A5B7GC47_PORTR|nr:hypothetical protein [Portunus trituberculatus]